MSSRTQGELIEAAQRGDRAAILALVGQHQDAVYRFGRRMCSSEQDAEDVMQETLMTAVQKIGDFRGEASFTSWLYAIARSRCWQRHRTSQRHTELDESALVDHSPPPDENFGVAELRATMQEALDELEPMYREAVLLRDMEGLSTQEAAEALGLSVAALKSRLHRARAMLKERVERAMTPRLRQLRGAPGEADAAPGATCRDIVALLRQHATSELTPETCAVLDETLARCDAEGDDTLALRALLGECKRCSSNRPPPRIQLSVQGAIREYLARTDG